MILHRFVNGLVLGLVTAIPVVKHKAERRSRWSCTLGEVRT